MKSCFLRNERSKLEKVIHRIFNSILIIILFTSIVNAQKFSIKPKPQWVVLTDSIFESEVDYMDIQSGYYFKNYDNIYNHHQKSDFIRTKTKLVTSSGVEALSQINITFDTSYQSVAFHHCKIIRNDKEIDKTNSIKFNLINQEQGLGYNVISGVMSLHAVLDDIRRGDELEIAYTILGSNPIHANHLNARLFLQDVNHIDQLSILYITDKDFDYQYKVAKNNGVEIAEYVVGTEKYLKINAYSVKPVDLSRHASYSHIPYNFIEISSFDNWNEVETWAQSLFEEDPSPMIAESYKLMTKDEEGMIAKATAILDFVQNSIRYTSVNGGIGSFKASLPSIVLDRNFGDCKDKSWLLVRLLKENGFSQVYPVLVNSIAGRKINEYLPGYIHFDHVIVKCIVGNDTLWIDPSLSLQGGHFLNRLSYDYGYGFVVGNNSQHVEKMKVDDQFSRTEIIENFNFENLDGNGTLEVFSTFTGKKADIIRAQFDQIAQKDIENGFKEIYSKIFVDVRSSKRLEIKDEYINNKFTIKESYVIGKPWKPYKNGAIDGFAISYEPLGIYNYLSPMSCDSIRTPIEMNKDNNYVQQTNFILPDGSVYLLSNFETNNKAYFFKKEQKIKSVTETEIVYSFRSLSDEILPEDFIKICEEVNEDSRKLLLNIFYSK
jgi:hypothetical protein